MGLKSLLTTEDRNGSLVSHFKVCPAIQFSQFSSVQFTQFSSVHTSRIVPQLS